MKELLTLILSNITLHPDEVVIEETTEGDTDVYTITVNPEDMGRVIGKAGKVIRAIRSLAHVVAIRQNKRFRINLAEVGGAVMAEPAMEAQAEEAQVEETETPAAPEEPASKEDVLAEALEE